MAVSRRALLRGALGSLALTGAGLGGRAVQAAGALTSRNVPGRGRSYKVLEIYFAGAPAHRETFWVEQPDELPVNRGLGSLDPLNEALLASGAPGDWTQWLLGRGDWLNSAYRVGTAGSRSVHLGPGFAPLVEPDGLGRRLADRLRVVAMGHDIEPHEGAHPLTILGERGRNPNDAAFSVAPVLHRHSGKLSFCLYDSAMADARYVAQYTGFTGPHGTRYSPVALAFDNAQALAQLSGSRIPERDALLEHYRTVFGAGLEYGYPTAVGSRARSTATTAYDAALEAALATPRFSSALGRLTASTGASLWDNGSRRAIQAAVELLQGGLSQYICVADAGVIGDSFGANSRYDSHNVSDATRHAAIHTGNFLNVLRTLRDEVDAGRLDLDDTLVVLNCEFGRYYARGGTEHCHRGYAIGLLGGPVQARGLQGDLPFTATDDGMAFERSQPAWATGSPRGGRALGPPDLRAAVLQAAGVHPFQTDVYDADDTSASPGQSRDDAADQLATFFFG